MDVLKIFTLKKTILKLIFIFIPIWIQAQQALVPYTAKLPKVEPNGNIITPDGKTYKIEGFKDKETVVFFLVRHAEKDTAGGSNADLNPIGRGRANAIVSIFKKIAIHKVYSTNVPRTKSTALPLAKMKRRQVEIYDAKKQKEFFETVVKNGKNQKIFVVGHSNTISQLVNILRGEDTEKDIPDKEYSRMYIVSLKKIGAAQVQVIAF